MVQEQENLALTVRAGDYDRFLAIQLAAAGKRGALYAVTAFHLELARVAESVSDALIGHIRLAWWREALEEIIAGKTPRNHPVVLALAEVHREYPEMLGALLPMAEARAADLDETLLAEEAAWLAYLDGTAGILHQSWGMILDAAQFTTHREIIAAQARGYAMVGLTRAIPFLAQQGFHRFPATRVAGMAPGEKLNASVEILINESASLLTPARLPKSLRPLGGLVRLGQMYIQQMRAVKYDPYRLRNPRLSAVLRLIQMKFNLC